MAYITSDEVKEIRNNIKKAFPAKAGWKWSVVRRHHSSVCATLMQYPAGYDFPTYDQVNHFHFERDETYGKRETVVLKKVNEILHKNHWDKSDIMTDYFHCAYFVSLHIGKWNREAVQATPKVKKVTPKKEKPAPTIDYNREYLQLAEFIGIQV